MNKIFTLAVLALSLVLAPTLAATAIYADHDEDDEDKDTSIKKAPKDKKTKQCNVKAQVKVINAVNNTVYTVQLEDLTAQSKLAVFNQTEIDEGDNNLAFNFAFKKSSGSDCPEKGDILEGNVNGQEFVVLVNWLTKPNKVAVELDSSPVIDGTTQ